MKFLTIRLTSNHLGVWLVTNCQAGDFSYNWLRLPLIKKEWVLIYKSCDHRIKVYKYDNISETGPCKKCKKIITIDTCNIL